jgi:hypothetical protein
MEQVLLEHKNYWGTQHESRAAWQLIEEMAELTVALSHHMRNRDANVIEELADVEMCLSFVKDAMGIKWRPITEEEGLKEAEYRSVLTQKAERLSKRLKEARAGGIVP